jgi:response regulator RpfG family c-di-GMP phosphodiesterase
MLRTTRPCKDAWTDERTLKYIQDQSGRKFNPEVVDEFLKMVSELDPKDMRLKR